MHRAGLAEPRPKVAAIQALRAIAALTVAVVHLTGGFARHIDQRLSDLPSGEQFAQSAVALFFLISGCVMVLSSKHLFGSARGVLVFWRRRAARVLPPYWIAAGLMAAATLALGHAFDPAFALGSLVFAGRHADSAGGVPFVLFLWPGWTLFYELVFYLLFGAFVVLGRLPAVAVTTIALAGLVIVGQATSPDSLMLFAATRPIVLLFVAGMLAGLALDRGWGAPGWTRWGAVAGATVLLGWAAPPSAPLGFGYLAWAGLPAALVFFAVLGGPLRLPFAPVFAMLGDASYAIYLLHVPIAHVWMRVFNQWWHHPGGSLGYLALGIPLVIALSLAFHRWVERPMTDCLNRLFGDGSAKRADLPRTLAP